MNHSAGGRGPTLLNTASESSLTRRPPTFCGVSINCQYQTDSDAENPDNDIYGFKASDCKDYEFDLLAAEVAGVSFDSEHVLEAQVEGD